MVYRVYVEKKPGFDVEAQALARDIRSFLGIGALTGLRLLNRYDVEGLDDKYIEAFTRDVLSEPQLDATYLELPEGEFAVFAVEALPGQYDQRADSAAQCAQLAFGCERPAVRTAKAYLLYGSIAESDVEAIKKYVINPVESREASLATAETLTLQYALPETVKTLEGFISLDEAGLKECLADYSLAMDLADISFFQRYFIGEKRDPTITELRVADTYWSDHCRHTTFLTHIEGVEFDDHRAEAAYGEYLAARARLGRSKPITLMDIATIGAKVLKAEGKLDDLDESDEINACTIKIRPLIDGRREDWLLLFKNETHNHPTEIEPFGGAATCIGGAIRDPLSGRGYVYQAMRVTGAADPTGRIEDALPGKLPQRKLTTTAAAGYSSYGNQIGLATGLVDEKYHPGYAAKRLEIGAVIGAVPAENVRREEPTPGDAIVLLGGRTGRDGCGGATGSSKSHDAKSLETCGSQVQKGNAPEERKLQRLFRNPRAARLIKRCNDFGAGGVSVAIGELARGLRIDLNAVPRKYDGLDGTELAISESQERMAVALDAKDLDEFLRLAASENLEATKVAEVTDDDTLTMVWNGREIVRLSRAFVDSNGAPKATRARVAAPKGLPEVKRGGSLNERLAALAGDLNICSKRGLAERFDSTIGAGSVLMPFGGARQLTPAQAMAALLPVTHGSTSDCSVMAYGFDPYFSEADPFEGARRAVIESIAKLVATGAPWRGARLTLQEYFPRTGTSPERWGLPLAALLGALSAQLQLGIPAIGGKDSMSGSFEHMDVPPTLVSFAVAMAKAEAIISPEFKAAGSLVCLLEGDDPAKTLDEAERLIRQKKAVSACALTEGGTAAAIIKMCLGNRLGFRFERELDYAARPASFVMEMAPGESAGEPLGRTIADYAIEAGGERADMADIERVYEGRLEKVFPSLAAAPGEAKAVSRALRTSARPAASAARPRVLIPVFPGTNCEYDAARAFERAGAEAETFVVNNLSAAAARESAEAFAKLIETSQILFLPGGFSGGDEPDGSAKFITAFLRNPKVAEALTRLLDARGGLVGGVCNGFQALVKLGLVPYGKIIETDANCPTLTYNSIGRHQSRLVRTRVCSTLSPWLGRAEVGDVHLTAISHGEGRFIASEALLNELAATGRIATQYVDESGAPSMDISVNPNGSAWAVEGICSPDGRVFGRMAHSERAGEWLYKNVPGEKRFQLFEGAVDYFK